MATIREILESMKVGELRQLARNNKIKLVTSGLFFGGERATRKDDIIEILLDSGKITKKKIEAVRKPAKKARSIKPKRKRLAKASKTLILNSQHHKCAMCKADISKLPVHYDHRIPLALDGVDEIENIQGLCPNCHAIKTQRDSLAISRARKK